MIKSNILPWVLPAILVAPAVAEPPTLDEVQRLQSTAIRAQNAGDYETAESFHRKTLDAVTQLPGFPPSERARVMNNLASVLNFGGEPDEALPILDKASEILAAHPSQDPGLYIALDINIGKALALLERFEQAEVHSLKALARVRDEGIGASAYGAEAAAGYAFLLSRTGRPVEAAEGYEFALAFWSDRLPEDHALVQYLQRELEAVKDDRPSP